MKNSNLRSHFNAYFKPIESYFHWDTVFMVASLELLQERLQVVTHHPMQPGVLGRAAAVTE